MRWQPALRVAAPYYDDPVYINALARSVRAGLATVDFEPEVVLASYHGIPQAFSDKGRPRPYRHCAETTRLLGKALALDEEGLRMTFQSRFGRSEWLKPYTSQTLRDLTSHGVRRAAVVTPGFAADCLETLEEIGVENAGYFREAGGERFAAIPCLNDSDDGMAVVEAVARRSSGAGRSKGAVAQRCARQPVEWTALRRIRASAQSNSPEETPAQRSAGIEHEKRDGFCRTARKQLARERSRCVEALPGPRPFGAVGGASPPDLHSGTTRF